MKPMHNDVISVYRTPLFGDRALVVVPWPRCHAHAPRAERTHARTHARTCVRTYVRRKPEGDSSAQAHVGPRAFRRPPASQTGGR